MSEAIPESRNYTHTRCRTVTALSENGFTALSDPFSVVPATYCVGCETHFPLDQFTWDDTGEIDRQIVGDRNRCVRGSGRGRGRR